MSRASFEHDLRPLHREFHISLSARERFGVEDAVISLRGTALVADFATAQRLAAAINRERDALRYPELAVRAGDLYAAALLDEAMHLVIDIYRERVDPQLFDRAEARLGDAVGAAELEDTLRAFVEAFPTTDVAKGKVSPQAWLDGSSDGEPHRHVALEELLMLHLASTNPAMERFHELFDERELRERSAYEQVVARLRDELGSRGGFGDEEGGGAESLLDLLEAPVRASPTSLEGQLQYVRERWGSLLGGRFRTLIERILRSIDVLKEERRPGFGGPGPSVVLDAHDLRGRGREEYEAFSADESWMPRLVLIAKSTYVWLDQLSKRYRQDIRRLDQIPDEVLDELAGRGFTGLWLIGLWERSEASRKIKHLRGQEDAVASAYALYDYRISADLGGDAAYENLRDRAWRRGIRLASDMVPNHVGIDGRWVLEHPEWFVQLDRPPYPGYTFQGPDLSSDGRAAVYLEDHYYDSTDAAVVFKRVDRASGRERYIYHGNDGTSMPWNDTAQLDYLNPDVREAVIQTILEVARRFPIIRFDAAMTLAKQHIQRLWYPEPGSGGAIPSRSQYGSMPAEEFERRIPEEFWREVVDRVAEEVPGTLLLAEAFWMMEGYFVRTLGMHRVYNSAFMNMLKREENDKYRQLMKNILEFDPEILKRFVNFMNNPDEETAVAQFGRDDKYFGTTLLMSTLPGLPMYGHGQVEGFTEKYGMEYRRAKLDEQPDEGLIERHRREIFPILHRREQFAHVEHFRLYDVRTEDGVSEDVYAYSNRHRGRASLVLYNNKFHDAAGWIRESAPFAVKSDGGKELRTEHVASALGLAGGSDRFVVMRDAVAGTEVLRRSDEIREHGLRVELGAFKYKAFVDLHEVVDVDGTYEELWRRLSGAAVPSVEDARREVVLAPVHEAFRVLVRADDAEVDAEASFARFVEVSREHASLELLPDAAERFEAGRRRMDALIASRAPAAAASPAAGESAGDARAGGARSAGPAATERTAGSEAPGLAGDAGPGAEGAPAGAPAGDGVPTPLLRAIVALEPLGRHGELARELRLDRPLARELERSGVGAHDAWVCGRLFLALCDVVGDLPVATLRADAVLARFAASAEAREALGVNWYQGTAWFERERYRTATSALHALAAWSHPDDEDDVARFAERLATLEEESGYRFELIAEQRAQRDREGSAMGEAAPLETREDR